MMQTALRTVGLMNSDERKLFLESNGIEKVLKDSLGAVIKECQDRCGPKNTGYVLRAVISGDGAGPVLEEGIAVAFARASRPQGRPATGGGRSSAEQISDMETAFRLAGDSKFRQKSPEFAAFQVSDGPSRERREG